MSCSFILNNLEFKFEDADERTGIALKIASREILISSTISAAQANAIGNVFKAVAKVRGFKE
jgi:hypothetical protein